VELSPTDVHAAPLATAPADTAMNMEHGKPTTTIALDRPGDRHQGETNSHRHRPRTA
jgi:hypothetical protein